MVFVAPGVDPRIAQLRYDNHCERVQEALKSVYELRRDLGIPSTNLASPSLHEKEGGRGQSQANPRRLSFHRTDDVEEEDVSG